MKHFITGAQLTGRRRLIQKKHDKLQPVVLISLLLFIFHIQFENFSPREEHFLVA